MKRKETASAEARDQRIVASMRWVYADNVEPNEHASGELVTEDEDWKPIMLAAVRVLNRLRKKVRKT
jgi:hypothetical protein